MFSLAYTLIVDKKSIETPRIGVEILDVYLDALASQHCKPLDRKRAEYNSSSPFVIRFPKGIGGLANNT